MTNTRRTCKRVQNLFIGVYDVIIDKKMPILSTLKNTSSNSLVVSTSNDMPTSVLIPANTQRNLMKSTSDSIITDNSENFNTQYIEQKHLLFIFRIF